MHTNRPGLWWKPQLVLPPTTRAYGLFAPPQRNPSTTIEGYTMPAQPLAYHADGLAMRGHLAHPGGETPRPGVLVFPEAFGLGTHAKSRADRLAGLGYVALAADLHGNQYNAAGLEEALALLAPLREHPAKTRARAAAAHQALLAQPNVDPTRIAAIGYCFGGTMALELARSGAQLAAVAGFHSGLATKTPADAKNIQARVLVCIGADDPSIDAAQRAAFETEMREGHVNWQMSLYGKTVHSFTNPDADKLGRPEFAAYNQQADRRSWSEMLTLFDEAFA
jgi:dienelactone hydrolase